MSKIKNVNYIIQKQFMLHRDIRNCQEKGYVGEEERIALKNRRPRFVSGQKNNILEWCKIWKSVGYNVCAPEDKLYVWVGGKIVSVGITGGG